MQDRNTPPRLGAPTGAHHPTEPVIDLQALPPRYGMPEAPGKARDWLARGLAAAALSVLGLLLLGKLGEREAPPPQPPEKEEKIIEDEFQIRPPVRTPPEARLKHVDAVWTATEPVRTTDLEFRVFVTSSDLAFDFAEVDRLNLAGKPMSLLDTLLTPVFTQSMAACKAMVVLGTASQEGDERTEAQRARDRSEHVQYQIWSSGLLECPLYTLNLGKARPSVQDAQDPARTAHQRRLVVVTVLDASPQTLDADHRLRAALHRALGQLKGLPVDLTRDYSSFDLVRKH